MNEELKNEVVEKAFDELTEKAEALDKAIAETGVKPASALTEAANNMSGKNIVIGVGLTLGGVAGGIALDRWVFPWIGKTVNGIHSKLKAAKEERKAKKAAKKAQIAAPETPATNNEVPADQNSKNED